jgi:hypothetical protein
MNVRLSSRPPHGRLLRRAESVFSRPERARGGSVLAVLWIWCILDRLHSEGG